jgi:putative membrane protein
MGGMMGNASTAGPWIILWIVLGVALLVTASVGSVRVLSSRRAEPLPGRADEPPGLQEAHATLRMRYASGEISREDYLQGKVELED